MEDSSENMVNNLPSQNPFELVSLEKVNNERERVLTYAEYDRLINIATTSKLHILRDVIMFAYMTGARWSEIMKLFQFLNVIHLAILFSELAHTIVLSFILNKHVGKQI